jgi:hypothetical protein
VICMGPVWMGKIATPLRAYFAYLKKHSQRYAFVSISGGADGVNSNPNLMDELVKRAGRKPALFLEFHIADLLSTPHPTRDDTSSYHLKESDVKTLTHTVVQAVQKLS